MLQRSGKKSAFYTPLSHNPADCIKIINELINNQNIQTTDLISFFKSLEATGFNYDNNPDFFNQEVTQALANLLQKNFARLIVSAQLEIIVYIRALNLPDTIKTTLAPSFKQNLHLNMHSALPLKLDATHLIYAWQYLNLPINEYFLSVVLDSLKMQIDQAVNKKVDESVINFQFIALIEALASIKFSYTRASPNLQDYIFIATAEFFKLSSIPKRVFLRAIQALATINFELKSGQEEVRIQIHKRILENVTHLEQDELCEILAATGIAFPSRIYNHATQTVYFINPSPEIVAAIASVRINELDKPKLLHFFKIMRNLAVTIDRLPSGYLSNLQTIILQHLSHLSHVEFSEVLRTLAAMHVRSSEIPALHASLFLEICNIFTNDKKATFNFYTFAHIFFDLSQLGFDARDLPISVTKHLSNFLDSIELSEHIGDLDLSIMLTAFSNMNFTKHSLKNQEQKLIDLLTARKQYNANTASQIILSLAQLEILNQELLLKLILNKSFLPKQAHKIHTAMDLLADKPHLLRFFAHPLLSATVANIKSNAHSFLLQGLRNAAQDPNLELRTKLLTASLNAARDFSTNVQQTIIIDSVKVDLLLKNENIVVIFDRGNFVDTREANNKLLTTSKILEKKGYKVILIAYDPDVNVMLNNFIRQISNFFPKTEQPEFSPKLLIEPDSFLTTIKYCSQSKDNWLLPFTQLSAISFETAHKLICEQRIANALLALLQNNFQTLDLHGKIDVLSLLFNLNKRNKFTFLVHDSFKQEIIALLRTTELQTKNLDFLVKFLQAVTYINSSSDIPRELIFHALVSLILTDLQYSERKKSFLDVLLCLHLSEYNFDIHDLISIKIQTIAKQYLTLENCSCAEFNKMLYILSKMNFHIQSDSLQNAIVSRFHALWNSNNISNRDLVEIIYSLNRMGIKYNPATAQHAEFILNMNGSNLIAHLKPEYILRFIYSLWNLGFKMHDFSAQFSTELLQFLTINFKLLNQFEASQTLYMLCKLQPQTALSEDLQRNILLSIQKFSSTGNYDLSSFAVTICALQNLNFPPKIVLAYISKENLLLIFAGMYKPNDANSIGYVTNVLDVFSNSWDFSESDFVSIKHVIISYLQRAFFNPTFAHELNSIVLSRLLKCLSRTNMITPDLFCSILQLASIDKDIQAYRNIYAAYYTFVHVYPQAAEIINNPMILAILQDVFIRLRTDFLSNITALQDLATDLNLDINIPASNTTAGDITIPSRNIIVLVNRSIEEANLVKSYNLNATIYRFCLGMDGIEASIKLLRDSFNIVLNSPAPQNTPNSEAPAALPANIDAVSGSIREAKIDPRERAASATPIVHAYRLMDLSNDLEEQVEEIIADIAIERPQSAPARLSHRTGN